MESTDKERIRALMESNTQLRRLYEEHLDLDELVDGFEGKTYLTREEQVELKTLKRKKLLGVDAMMQILAESR